MQHEHGACKIYHEDAIKEPRSTHFTLLPPRITKPNPHSNNAKKSGLNTATGPHMRSSFTFSFKPISTLLLPQNAAGQYRSSSNALDREPLIYLFFAVRCLLDRRKASSFWTSSSSRDRRFFALGTVTCFVPPRWSKASLTVSGSFPFFLSVPGSPRAFGVAGSVGSCGAHATFFP